MKFTFADSRLGISHRAYVEKIVTAVAHEHIRWNLEVDPAQCESWYRHEAGWYLR